MHQSDTVIFDSGRFPLWFRLPVLTFGLFALWFAAALAAHVSFGVNLGLPMSDVHGSPVPGSLASFAIALLWIFVWFARLQILFDSTRHELIIRTKGFVGWHARRVSLVGAREFHVRRVPNGLASRIWRVSMVLTDGRSEPLVDIASGVESLVESLGAGTNLPVINMDKAD